MKRLSALFLAVAMIFALSACGGSPSSSAPAAPAPASSEAAPAASAAPAAESKAWTPERSIELVACYGAGGGHDILLRTMQKVIVNEKLSSASFNVVNKDGGSGAIGMSYVNGHKGDPHYLMCTTSSFAQPQAWIQLPGCHPHRPAGPGSFDHRGAHRFGNHQSR